MLRLNHNFIVFCGIFSMQGLYISNKLVFLHIKIGLKGIWNEKIFIYNFI